MLLSRWQKTISQKLPLILCAAVTSDCASEGILPFCLELGLSRRSLPLLSFSFLSYIRSLSRKRKFFRRIASRYRYLISVPPPGILGSSKRGLRVSVCTGSRTCLCLQSPQYRCFSSPSLRALRFESEHVERRERIKNFLDEFLRARRFFDRSAERPR